MLLLPGDAIREIVVFSVRSLSVVFLLGSLFRSSSQRLFACLVCVDRVFCWKSLVASVYGLVSSCSLSLLVCTCSFSQSLWIRLNLLSWLFENSFDKCSWLIENSANELRMLPKRTRASSWCCGSSRVSAWCCGSGTVAALMGSGFLLLGSVVLLVGHWEPLTKMLPFSEWWRRDQLPRVGVASTGSQAMPIIRCLWRTCLGANAPATVAKGVADNQDINGAPIVAGSTPGIVKIVPPSLRKPVDSSWSGSIFLSTAIANARFWQRMRVAICRSFCTFRPFLGSATEVVYAEK